MFAPSNAGKSSDDWSLSSGGSGGGRLNSNATPKHTSARRGSVDGGRSVITSNGVTRSAILPSAQINASNFRPMTGLARVENRRTFTSSSSKSKMPIVESFGYYREIIQSKIDEIAKEMERLRTETEMADVHSEPRIALDRKHDSLVNAVRKLEGSLADYNLARGYAGSGTALGDIKTTTLSIVDINKKLEKEIDAVFFKRKKVEDEISRVEAEMARLHADLESKVLNGDDDKVDEYRCSVNQIKATIVESEQQDDDIVLIRHKIKTLDCGDQGIKKVYGLKKQLEQVEEDIKVVLMTDDEGREYLLRKIVGLQLSTKDYEGELSLLDGELQTLDEVQKISRTEKLMGGAALAHARLFDKDNLLKQYLERLPEMKAQLEEERSRLLVSIETLRDDIKKKEEWTSNVKSSSKEELELMKGEVVFTRKDINSNKRTNAILRRLIKKLMDEFAHVESLGQRIASEMVELEKRTCFFMNEIEQFGKLAEQKGSAQETRICLSDLNDTHASGIQLLDMMLLPSSSSTQHLRNICSSSEWRELQDLKSKLCIQGEYFKKLQESQTDYGSVKAECLQLIAKINERIIANVKQ